MPLDELKQSVLRMYVAVVPDAEIALCDTTDRATPYQVRDRFDALKRLNPEHRLWAFHWSRHFCGMGVANALFALQVRRAGARRVGSRSRWMPIAPGATGNTATEDLGRSR